MKKFICTILASLTFLESGFLVKATTENTDNTQEKVTTENTDNAQEKVTTGNTDNTRKKTITENTENTQGKNTTIKGKIIKAAFDAIIIGGIITINFAPLFKKSNHKENPRVRSAINATLHTPTLKLFERVGLHKYLFQYLCVDFTASAQNPYYSEALYIIKLIEQGNFRKAYNALPPAYRHDSSFDSRYQQDYTNNPFDNNCPIVNLDNIKKFSNKIDSIGNVSEQSKSDLEAKLKNLYDYAHTDIIKGKEAICKENIEIIKFTGTCDQATIEKTFKKLKKLAVDLKTTETYSKKLAAEFNVIKNALKNKI